MISTMFSLLFPGYSVSINPCTAKVLLVSLSWLASMADAVRSF